MGNGFHSFGPEPSRAAPRSSDVVSLSPREESTPPGRHRRVLGPVPDAAADGAEIDVDVAVLRRTAHVAVMVTRDSGDEPATGEIELVTDELEVVLPLVDGRAVVLLTGRREGGAPIVGETAIVNYFGDERTEAASTSVRLSHASG